MNILLRTSDAYVELKEDALSSNSNFQINLQIKENFFFFMKMKQDQNQVRN